jgi:hypothetical protein
MILKWEILELKLGMILKWDDIEIGLMEVKYSSLNWVRPS